MHRCILSTFSRWINEVAAKLAGHRTFLWGFSQTTGDLRLPESQKPSKSLTLAKFGKLFLLLTNVDQWSNMIKYHIKSSKIIKSSQPESHHGLPFLVGFLGPAPGGWQQHAPAVRFCETACLLTDIRLMLPILISSKMSPDGQISSSNYIRMYWCFCSHASLPIIHRLLSSAKHSDIIVQNISSAACYSSSTRNYKKSTKSICS